MKDHPILFSTPMVKAILEGKKLQTRRDTNFKKAINDPNHEWYFVCLGAHPQNENDKRLYAYFKILGSDTWTYALCPYGRPGDLLWIREIWCRLDGEIVYKASVNHPKTLKWKPSIFMPKESARIWLKIKDIGVERVQDISNEDIRAEGAAEYGCTTHRLNWEQLWVKINGRESWDSNPWVWVVKFERHEK